MSDRSRPLSPHLQIYRPQVTSLFSFAHRLTGVALAFAALLLTYWLSAAAYGPAAFERAQEVLQSLLGRVILFGFTFSLFYHLCNGIRHLGWDMGWGFDLPKLRLTAGIVAVAALVLTVLSWLMAYGVMGKL